METQASKKIQELNERSNIWSKPLRKHGKYQKQEHNDGEKMGQADERQGKGDRGMWRRRRKDKTMAKANDQTYFQNATYFGTFQSTAARTLRL